MIRRYLPSMLQRFFELESAGGIIMLAVTAIALFCANTLLVDEYEALIHYPIHTWPLTHWVSEVLMVFFFLLVGLELKREMVEGFLAKRDQIILPGLAALGGMIVPAIIYVALNEAPNLHGWAIPTATDIAFAVCVITLIGRGLPPSIKIFLLAIAIFDDLGAILIIAFFYSGIQSVMALTLVAVGTLALILLNRFRVTFIPVYLFVGVFLWFCLHEAGVHTTIAGVLVGLFMPTIGAEGQSPLDRLLKALHPWVSYLIMPLFAFVSAGVTITSVPLADAFSPIVLGIMLGLFIGKQIGIFSATWLCVKAGFAKLPEDANWKHVYGVSIIAGIGFTMSLFIGLLAFPELMQPEVKMGVIGGSLLSTIWGAFVLKWARK